MILRSLVMLAKALWRRIPNTIYKPILWLYYYIIYATVTIISLVVFPKKVGLAISLWTWFREIDDILDGDDYRSPDTVKMIVSRKKVLVTNLSRDISLKSLHGTDRLLFLSMHLSKKNGIQDDFIIYFKKIWDIMLTEYEWRVQKRIPSESEIKNFANLQDEAILFFSKMFLWVEIEQFKLLEIAQDGLFTRIDWITDLEKDLKAGIVHFSFEDCMKNHLTYEMLVETQSDILMNENLKVLIKKELELLVSLWGRFTTQRQNLLSATRNKFFSFVYNKFAISRFEKDLKKLCKAYRVAYG